MGTGFTVDNDYSYKPPKKPKQPTKPATTYKPPNQKQVDGPSGGWAASQQTTPWGDAGREEEFLFNLANQQPQNGYGIGYGGGGGGGRSGGGGGGGVSPAKIAALLATVTAAGDKDREAAKNAFAGLDQYMANLGNPYADLMPAEAAQVGGGDLQALLASQGGNDAGLRAQAQFLQASNGASAAASNRRAQMLKAAQAAWNQGSRTAGQQAALQVDGELAAQVLAMKAALEARKAGL